MRMMLLRKSVSAATLTTILRATTTIPCGVCGLSVSSYSSISTSLSSSSSSSSSTTTNTGILGARCLGGTDLVVSEACLGTMTFGVQNNRDDAFEQIDYARSCGVNFIDTAELYPVPVFAPEWRAGATEEIIGHYLNRIGSSERDELVIASKISGYIPNSPIAAQRYDPPKKNFVGLDSRLDADSIKMACDASLRRLQTDRIDLYQVHWPDRYVPVFGQTVYDYDKKRDDEIPIEETAAALRDLIEEGKIRYIGISNETPLGLCQWVQACDKLGIRDKLATIQNSYSLLDRRFETDLAEICNAYNIGLLPWSVLAGGLLSGKYRKKEGGIPTSSSSSSLSNSRFVKYPKYMSRWSPASASQTTLFAAEEYAKIAEEQAGMTPAELAIAFVRSRRFVSDAGSTLIGATTLDQLKANLAPFLSSKSPMKITLDEDIMDAINKVHLMCPNPSCSL